MGTKLKNKYVYGLFFIISIYMLGLSMLSAVDFINNKEFAQRNSYFKSYSFRTQFKEYFNDVQLLTVERKAALQKSRDVNTAAKIDELNAEVKNKVDSKKSLRYYLKDKSSGEIYTNIENLSNIDDYINKQAIYVENFPRSSGIDGELVSINTWFQRNNVEGSIAFIKASSGYNQMEEDYKYYNSIRERIIQEVILGSILLVIGIVLLILLKLKASTENKYIKLIDKWYEKIPLDSRIVLFIIYGISMLHYLNTITFFYKPLGMKHFFRLTIVAAYTFYLIVNIRSALKLLRYKEELSLQLRDSIAYQILLLTHDSAKIKVTIGREVFLFMSTVLFGISLVIGLLGAFSGNRFVMIFSLLYIVIYIMVVPLNILKRAAALNKIINGTEAIASGNLDYFIEETGDRDFIKIPRNINSMKESFKKSVESQLKSERLKTELITNVSHDLKTPLTSIINYVSLLKKEGLSTEQSKKYVEVLDLKSQRLKVLIEDLFEASKVSSGAIELNIEQVDIAALLRQALGEFDEKISSSSLIFRTNIPIEEVNLNLDGKRTWRVFENLISNALKYSQPNSRVYIDLFEQEGKVIITMKNMSSYELDFDVNEIFERFKRGDKARSTEGSGLGLSIAKSIVELQGGKMRIDIDGDLFKVTVEFSLFSLNIKSLQNNDDYTPEMAIQLAKDGSTIPASQVN